MLARKLLLLSKGRRERAVYAVIRYTRGRSVFKSSRKRERGNRLLCFEVRCALFVYQTCEKELLRYSHLSNQTDWNSSQ